MRKYSIMAVFIIAIAITISIYHLSLDQFASDDKAIQTHFWGRDFIESFKQAYAAPQGGGKTDMAQLIARAINGEARGETYTGQVAVGAVILNRVEDSRFPNTIAGVIYQPGAFTAVSDGQINLSISTNSTVYKAARDALGGWDPTGGCVYYFNPATATSKWIWGRPQVTRIGKHIFAK